MKVLLDTNILVYAEINDPIWSKICSKLIESDNENAFYISQRSLLEYFRVCTSNAAKIPVERVIKNIELYIENFEILYDNPISTQLMLELALETGAKSGKIFDLNILASALDNEIDVLYTVNIKDFPKVKNLEILLPSEFSLA